MLSEDQMVSIYRSSIQPIYAYVSRRVEGQRELAEDIVQETMLRAVEHWRQNGVPEKPLAWLKVVARNLLISHYRKAAPQIVGELETEPADESWRPESLEERNEIRRGLGELRPEQVQLIEAAHFEEKSHRELSQDLGISERAVEGRLRRARLALKAALLRFVQ